MLKLISRFLDWLFDDDAGGLLSPSAVNALERCERFYRAYNLPTEIEQLGMDRLRKGLLRYGPDNYLLQSEEQWRHESLEELLDAFNMLGGMSRARGEIALCMSDLVSAIRCVHSRLQIVRAHGPVHGGTGVPPVNAVGAGGSPDPQSRPLSGEEALARARAHSGPANDNRDHPARTPAGSVTGRHG
jgi:hypothetical protein